MATEDEGEPIASTKDALAEPLARNETNQTYGIQLQAYRKKMAAGLDEE